jgi:hypothetical protein
MRIDRPRERAASGSFFDPNSSPGSPTGSAAATSSSSPGSRVLNTIPTGSASRRRATKASVSFEV